MTKLVGILSLTLMGFTSCATSWLPRQEGVLWASVASKATFSLGELTIATRPTTGNLKQTATDLARLAARNAGVPLDESAPGLAYRLSLYLEERDFGVDIDTYNSVVVVLKAWSPGDSPRQVGQVIYAEETKKTLRSANYLSQALQAVFVQFAKTLKDAP